MLHSGSASLSGSPLGCRRHDPRCPPSKQRPEQRTMPLARRAAEALDSSMAAEGCGGGGGRDSSGGGGGVVKDHAVVPPAIADPEDDPQQRADSEGEEEGTQCGVRAMTSAPVTEPPLHRSRGSGDNDDEGDEGDEGDEDNAAPSSFPKV